MVTGQNFCIKSYKSLYIRIFFIIASLINLNCSNKDCEYIDSYIKKASKEEVTQQKWDELIGKIDSKVKSCPAKAELLKDPCSIQKLLKGFNADLKIFQDMCGDSTKKAETTTKIFVENSDSMDGYIKGGAEFREAVGNLLVKLRHKTDKTKAYFLSDKMEYVDDRPEAFLSELSLDYSSKYSKLKNKKSGSLLNNLFKLILNQSNPGDISIFVTDGVYSVYGTKNVVQNELVTSKNLTMDLFIESIKQRDISTLVLQYSSNFVGNYYDMNLQGHQISSKKPYYIFVFSDSKTMEEFVLGRLEEFKLNENLTNYIYFKKDDPLNSPDFFILHKTYRLGSFSIESRTENIISEVKTSSTTDESAGKFGFSMAIDLKRYNLSKSYITDINNYDAGEICKVASVTDAREAEIDKLDQVDLKKQEANSQKKFVPTHIIAITCSPKISLANEIQIKMKYALPAWIEEGHTSDDSDARMWSEYKTFGLKYLVSGIYEAYREIQKQDLMNIKIKVKR